MGGIPLFLEQIAREYTSTGTCMIPRNYTGAGSLPLKIRYLCRRWSLYRSMRDKWPPKCEFTESLLQLDGGRRLFQLLSCFSLPYQARLSLLFLPGTGEGGGGVLFERMGRTERNDCMEQLSKSLPPRQAQWQQRTVSATITWAIIR